MMRRLVKPLVLTLTTLLLAWAVYLIGYNAGYAAGVIASITAQLKRAFKAPLGEV